MLRTVAECDKALKLLDMERNHILEIREYLKENGPVLIPTVRPKVKTDAILQIVVDNPGIDGQGIKRLVDKSWFDATGRQIQSAVSRLSRDGEIENRGKHGLGACWYVSKKE